MHEDNFDEAFWEERYRAHEGGEHSQLNPVLEAEAADLEPGIALDAGCGLGSGAIWLAARGWQVTAMDIASTALGRAQERAELADVVTRRIEWVHADLTTWRPERDRFDLVCAFYVHTVEPVEKQVSRLAAAVAPGGTLLVVGHGPSDRDHTMAPRPRFTPDEIAGALDPEVWNVSVAETRDRTVAGTNADQATLRDAVLRARKCL